MTADWFDNPRPPSLSLGGKPGPGYLARVPEIAERLGVKPLESPHPSTFVLHIGDGVEYDLFALISAFLDKVDAVTKP